MVAKTQKRKNKTAPKTRIVLKIFGLILLVAVISFGALAGIKIYNDGKKVVKKDDGFQNINTAEVDNESIKTPEPNEEEKKTTQGNDAKAKMDELEKQQAAEVERNANGSKKAEVLLNEPYQTDGKTIISSTIANVVETEGNCSYIFTNGSTTLTKRTRVLPNAKNTVCEAVVLENDSLSAGEWKVRLEYKSKNSEGVSETQTFTIQ